MISAYFEAQADSLHFGFGVAVDEQVIAPLRLEYARVVFDQSYVLMVGLFIYFNFI